MNSYEEQLLRVRRYHHRFKQLNAGMEHRAPSEVYIDDIYAFFQNCYHLKDWLKNDPAYTKHSNQQIEDHVSNTPVLTVCADICNGSKHLTFNRPPRSGNEPKLARKCITMEITDDLSGKEIPTKIKMQVEVEHAGNTLDAFQLATDALNAWETFVV